MTHLHLNIFPINLPDLEISVGVLPFHSRDAMRELRRTHAGTHVFNWVSVEENSTRLELIYAVRLDGAVCTIAQETQKIRLRENLGVARQLVNESFISGLAGRADRRMVDVDPLEVLLCAAARLHQKGGARSDRPTMVDCAIGSCDRNPHFPFRRARRICWASIRSSCLPPHGPPLLGMAR